MYLFFIGFIQISTQVVTKILQLESNIFISHYYFIGQIILLSFFYFEILQKKIIWFILAAFIIGLILQYLFSEDIYNKYNQSGILFSNLIIIMYSIFFLYKALSEKLEFTMINLFMLIYMLPTTLIFSSGNLVFNINIPTETIQLLLNINTLLYLVFQIVIFVEWWKNYSVAKAKS